MKIFTKKMPRNFGGKFFLIVSVKNVVLNAVALFGLLSVVPTLKTADKVLIGLLLAP